MLRSFLLGVLLTWAGAAPAATLSGRVTNTAGGGVYPLDLDVRVSSTGALVPTPGDTTTPAGDYTLTLAPGVYDVTYHALPGSHLFTKVVKSLNVQTVLVRNVTLGSGHYVSGRVVRSSDGTGVANANLNFHDPVTGAPANNVQDDLTDAQGYFTTLVDSGVFDVDVIAPLAARLVPAQIPSVPLTSDQNVGNVTLGAGFLLSGTITDLGLFPVPDSDIDVRIAGTRTKWFTPQDNADQDGAWSVLLPAGSYDVTAQPPVGEPLAPVTARAVTLAADLALPNFALPPGVALSGRCRTAGNADVAGVDVDVDSLPSVGRLETPNDQSAANGTFSVLVPTGSFRLTLTPPVATKLLPVRVQPVNVSGALDLGTVTHAAGHWVSGTVVESGSGTPIAGANLDLVRVSDGQPAITAGDVTDAAGYFRIVTDGDLYTLHIIPPDGTHDPLAVSSFRSLADTVVTLALNSNVVGVGEPRPAASLDLSAPWPNPARDATTIRFAARGAAALEVWDVTGRRLATLWSGTGDGTPIATRWDGRDAHGMRLATGLYFVVLRGAEGRVTRRVVLGR